MECDKEAKEKERKHRVNEKILIWKGITADINVPGCLPFNAVMNSTGIFPTTPTLTNTNY
jgi:hypothetical protein